jgi:starvation-inducible DNA-binding protein
MKASPTLTDNMQAVLVDLIELHLQGKQAHWNVVGKNFRDLHLQLDEIIDDARLFADETVKTMRDVHDQIDEEDPTTADLLHGFIAKLEQYAWMVDAENMEPTAEVVTPVGTEHATV